MHTPPRNRFIVALRKRYPRSQVHGDKKQLKKEPLLLEDDGDVLDGLTCESPIGEDL